MNQNAKTLCALLIGLIAIAFITAFVQFIRDRDVRNRSRDVIPIFITVLLIIVLFAIAIAIW